MKNIITILLLSISLTGLGQSYSPVGSQVFNTVTDLKSQGGINNAMVYVLGGSTVGDGRGGVYRWSSSNTEQEDLTYYNVIQVTGLETGRWIRTNQNIFPYPQGTLFRIGSLKIFTASGVTDANGEVTFNLTTENTSGGTAIFNSVFFNSGQATVNAPTPNDIVMGSVKTLSANNKVITFRFSKGALGVLGLATLAVATTNTPVKILIVGI